MPADVEIPAPVMRIIFRTVPLAMRPAMPSRSLDASLVVASDGVLGADSPRRSKSPRRLERGRDDGDGASESISSSSTLARLGMLGARRAGIAGCRDAARGVLGAVFDGRVGSAMYCARFLSRTLQVAT